MAISMLCRSSDPGSPHWDGRGEPGQGEAPRTCTCKCIHMSPMERRLQLLLDSERYARVEAEARASGRSVAAVIREAIDYRFNVDVEAARRREATPRFLQVASQSDHEPQPTDWGAIREAMDDELAAKLDQ